MVSELVFDTIYSRIAYQIEDLNEKNVPPKKLARSLPKFFCPEAKSTHRVEPSRTKPNQAESSQTEPSRTKPTQAKPSHPSWTKPSQLNRNVDR